MKHLVQRSSTTDNRLIEDFNEAKSVIEVTTVLLRIETEANLTSERLC